MSPSCTTASSRTTTSCARELKALGYEFATETDTEVIAHLIEHYQSDGADLLDAVRTTIARLRGAYAIAVHQQARTRPRDRRAPRQPDGRRAGRWRAVHRLGHPRPAAGHAPLHLSGRRRRRRRHASTAYTSTTSTARWSSARSSRRTSAPMRSSAASTATTCSRKSTSSRRRSPTRSKGASAGGHILTEIFGVGARELLTQDAQRASDRLRLELSRRAGRALLDRKPRRHSVQRGNRLGIPLSRCRRAGRYAVRQRIAIRRNRRHAGGAEAGEDDAATWRRSASATCRNPRSCANRN